MRVVTWLAGSFAIASACTEDEHCSLNGVCTSGVCVCDKPWTGDECGELAFKPAPLQPAYGGGTNDTLNFSTWGGNPVYKDGTYHLFAANIPGTLADWYKTSRIDHATSPNITGPYTFQDVVLPAFAHNPQIVHQVFKNGTERYVLFHIGQGGIHTALSPDGPFVETTPANWSCDNPAPYWDAGEEAWYVTCRTKKPGVMRATDLMGPWTRIGDQPVTPSTAPAWFEDPYLYRDARGHWHALFHACNLNVFGDCGQSPVSGHSFSRDLKNWTTLSTWVQPYTSVIAMEDGTSRTAATIERPKFFFNKEGQPTHLFNGAANVAGCQSANKSCCDCKLLDHTMTLVRPLDV